MRVEVVQRAATRRSTTGSARSCSRRARRWPTRRRHSGADEVAVYAEAGDDGVTVFVRDRGAASTAPRCPADRRGIAESIEGRMERVGGTRRP